MATLKIKYFFIVLSFFVSIKIDCSLKETICSSFKHKQKYNVLKEQISPIITSTDNIKNYTVIDIDKLIKDDILKKYEKLRIKFEQAACTDSPVNSSSIKQRVDDLEKACEIYLWTQNQENLSGIKVPTIILENIIVSEKEKITMLHELCLIGATHTINLLLQNTNINVNLFTKDGKSPHWYATKSKNQDLINLFINKFIFETSYIDNSIFKICNSDTKNIINRAKTSDINHKSLPRISIHLENQPLSQKDVQPITQTQLIQLKRSLPYSKITTYKAIEKSTKKEIKPIQNYLYTLLNLCRSLIASSNLQKPKEFEMHNMRK
jgi:hypothetical protein